MLQEQSAPPVKNAARMHEYVRLFDGAIKAAGAKSVLCMTWARLAEARAEREEKAETKAAGSGEGCGWFVVS